jgi:hypothetical protein
MFNIHTEIQNTVNEMRELAEKRLADEIRNKEKNDFKSLKVECLWMCQKLDDGKKECIQKFMLETPDASGI